MNSHVELRPGAYADSVTLLQVSRTVQGVPGVATAQVAMATPLNLEVLAGHGLRRSPTAPAPTTWSWRSGSRTTPPTAPSTTALAAVDAALAARRRVRAPPRRRAAAHHRRRAAPGAGRRGSVLVLGARAPARWSRRWTPSTPAAT